MIRRHFRLTLTLLALVLGACGKTQSPSVESADDLQRYSELPGLKAVHLPALRDELARLESEQATGARPSDAGFTTPTALGMPPGAAAGGETAASLPSVFAPDVQQQLLKQLDELYPAGPFKFSANALRAAIQLKDRYDEQRRRIRRIINNLDRGFGIQLTRGLAADTSFTDVATIGNRLDAIVAAELLSRDDLPGAIVTLREMTSTIEALAGEQHVVPRIVAVHRRGEALRILEAIATHPAATAETHRRLARIIDDQLADWPADARAWIGERVIGIHTYELVRDGYLLSILDDREQGRLRREVGFDRLADQVADNLDRDELFYLRAMRRTIAACERPYFERERDFREINRQLDSLRDSSAYPLVADLILWQHVQEGHRLQALDRARCEAWSIALAAVLAAPPPPYRVNPLTGTRYIMDPRTDRVIVDGIDPAHQASPIVIPRRS